MKVLRINANDTHQIRSFVLKDEFDQVYSYPNDESGQTFHLGAFVDNQLVSVASFFYSKHDLFSDEHQYRLRGMATLEKYRRQGLSSELLKMAFPIIKQNLCTKLWCESREKANGFYEKVGFIVDDGPFKNDKIGLVFLMSTNIQ